jgi:hypothetical protein
MTKQKLSTGALQPAKEWLAYKTFAHQPTISSTQYFVAHQSLQGNNAAGKRILIALFI